ncbi:MAG: hypothetical protein QE271_05510 [Bacteriovoracaceae bacterium]|nr:hypothetical protein [Bacteriovoracaceae bacterium]
MKFLFILLSGFSISSFAQDNERNQTLDSIAKFVTTIESSYNVKCEKISDKLISNFFKPLRWEREYSCEGVGSIIAKSKSENSAVYNFSFIPKTNNN